MKRTLIIMALLLLAFPHLVGGGDAQTRKPGKPSFGSKPAAPAAISDSHKKFKDSEVGWVYLGNQVSTTLSYTTDGGKRWNSREIRFPSGVNAFSLPRRDRGYVVGSHGMVYRYLAVPIDYTSKGMMDAPTMSSRPGAAPGKQEVTKSLTHVALEPR